jgi:hypothetical protein
MSPPSVFLFLILISLGSCSALGPINYQDDPQLCQVLHQMVEADQKYRQYERMTDSRWRLQDKIDRRNCRYLIRIVKRRGWPTGDRLNCPVGQTPVPVLIFRHAPDKFFSPIKEIIEIEYQAGRMGGGDYFFIKNHLEGRPPWGSESNGR